MAKYETKLSEHLLGTAQRLSECSEGPPSSRTKTLNMQPELKSKSLDQSTFNLTDLDINIIETKLPDLKTDVQRYSLSNEEWNCFCRQKQRLKFPDVQSW